MSKSVRLILEDIKYLDIVLHGYHGVVWGIVFKYIFQYNIFKT